MSRKREAVFMGLGILAGLALSGPAVQATTSITATLSSQPIYVDGQRISMTAYNIGGNNFVKLRDIGRAVGFGVTYDAATNSVHIDSTQSYQDEVQSVATVTEESVRATLAQLRETYPTGTVYPSPIAPPAAGPTTGAPTAPAGLHYAAMPLSVTFRGGGSTAQAGSRFAPVI